MSVKEMFMIHKICATLCDIPLNIFLPNGFFDFSARTSHLHRHYYTEIHVIQRGEAVYKIGEQKYNLCPGDFLVIPQHKMHSCVSITDNIRHSAFLIDKDVASVTQGALPCSLIEAFFEEISTVRGHGNYFSLTGYLSMMISQTLTDARVFASEMRDDSFIIDNYIEKHYANSPSLCELATKLRRSEKQTARLVHGHYGITFSELIIQKRMKTADLLQKTTNMTLKEISEYVGYSSYSGFYKAYNRFLKENRKTDIKGK